MSDASQSADSATYLARFFALHPKLIDLSLGRLEALLARLDNPHLKLPPVIHIAGTNGKGSTLAFLRALLEADGKTVHAFTSPHLVRFHERIRLSGEIVDEARLVDALARAEAANGGAPITFFEITTAAAFLLFSETPADVLLLEVGLGGRFDATNVIKNPLAAVITPVAMDHMAFLGDTIEKIAFEKAGIIKKGCPVIIGVQDEAAEEVMLEKADEMKAAPTIEGQDYTVFEENGRLIYQDEYHFLDLPLPNLLGRYQIDNAGLALATLSAINMLPDVAKLSYGLTHTHWPARLQRLDVSLLPDLSKANWEVYLDGAHNEAAATALAEAIAEMNEKNSVPLTLLIGMLTTKDARSFLAQFKGLAGEVITVPVPSGQEGAHASESPESLASLARELGLLARHFDSFDEAIKAIGQSGKDRSGRLLITGSLYLAGHVLEKLKAL